MAFWDGVLERGRGLLGHTTWIIWARIKIQIRIAMYELDDMCCIVCIFEMKDLRPDENVVISLCWLNDALLYWDFVITWQKRDE
jgi:hypothetical protein